MALNLRGVVIGVDDGKPRRYHWKIGTVHWDFMLSARRRLYRRGVDFSEIALQRWINCVDDALLFSLGYEACQASVISETPDPDVS